MIIVLAPDAFKGSLTAPAAAMAMERGLRRVWPHAEMRRVPMADGGEGTLDVLLAAAGGQRLAARVSGADGAPVRAEFGLLEEEGGPVAVLEAARVVGFSMSGALPVAQRSTVGLGELLRHCLDRGVRRFLVGLGGSSSNDGGCGLLSTLGVRLLDAGRQPLAPTPEGIARLDAVDFSGLDPRVAEADISVLTDVSNPLYGPEGATAVFGPQKGVASAEVAEIDRRLRHLGALCDAWFGAPLSRRRGSGAAGGLGYALQLLGGRRRSGAAAVAQRVGLDTSLRGADWVITGEGRSDGQTLHGKAPAVVAARARRRGVRVTLLSGALDRAGLERLDPCFDGCFSISAGPVSLERAMNDADALLADAAAQLARLFRAVAEPNAPSPEGA